MIALIFILVGTAVIAGAIALGLWKAFDDNPSTEPGKSGKFVATVGSLIGILIIYFGVGITEIGPGQVGVRTQFGQVQEGTLKPGLNYALKGIQGITIFDARTQAYNFEGIEGATKDLQAVGLSGIINFHIDAEQADEILQTLGGPDEYAQKVFLRQANTALKEVTPLYNAAEVVAKREEIAQTTLRNLTVRMAPLGIVIDRVSVENIGLNELFLQSVEAKQIAEQDYLARAEFEQQRTVKLAEGDRDALITRAEGEAQANDLINASLTDNLLQWATIQRLSDKIRVMMVPSDQGLIFDLKGLQDEPAS